MLIINITFCGKYIFYFNLDDLKLHDLFNNIPEFIRFLQPNENRKYVFLDEIQRLKNIILKLKPE